jgi:hypothetical protein
MDFCNGSRRSLFSLSVLYAGLAVATSGCGVCPDGQECSPINGTCRLASPEQIPETPQSTTSHVDLDLGGLLVRSRIKSLLDDALAKALANKPLGDGLLPDVDINNLHLFSQGQDDLRRNYFQVVFETSLRRPADPAGGGWRRRYQVTVLLKQHLISAETGFPADLRAEMLTCAHDDVGCAESGALVTLSLERLRNVSLSHEVVCDGRSGDLMDNLIFGGLMAASERFRWGVSSQPVRELATQLIHRTVRLIGLATTVSDSGVSVGFLLDTGSNTAHRFDPEPTLRPATDWALAVPESFIRSAAVGYVQSKAPAVTLESLGLLGEPGNVSLQYKGSVAFEGPWPCNLVRALFEGEERLLVCRDRALGRSSVQACGQPLKFLRPEANLCLGALNFLTLRDFPIPGVSGCTDVATGELDLEPGDTLRAVGLEASAGSLRIVGISTRLRVAAPDARPACD